MFRVAVGCILAVIVLTACNSKDKKDPIPPSGINNASQPSLLHAPLTKRATPHGFFVNSDGLDTTTGRIAGQAILDSSARSRWFVTDADSSSFTAKTPAYVENSIYAAKTQRSVYIIEQRLYSSDGVASVQLSGAETVEQFWLSPDESKIAYVANERYVRAGNEGYYVNELYIVNMNGNERKKINTDSDANILYFKYIDNRNSQHHKGPQFLANMSRLAFLASINSTKKTALFSVNVDGTDLQMVNALLAVDKNIHVEENRNDFTYLLAPDSSRIIYAVSDINATATRNSAVLYSAAPDGRGEKLSISGSMIADGGVYVSATGFGRGHSFAAMYSPDSQYVIFQANAEDITKPELYQVPVLGGGRVKLSGGLNIALGKRPIFKPNNTEMIFVGEGLTSVSNRIYSVNINYNQQPITVNLPVNINPGFDHIVTSLTLTPDASAVIYLAHTTASSRTDELFMANLNDSTTRKLSGAMITDGGLQPSPDGFPTFIIGPQGKQLVYRANAESIYDFALYLVDLQGVSPSAPKRITPAYQHSGSANSNMLGFYNGKFYFSYDQVKGYYGELFAYNLSDTSRANISATWPDFVVEDTYDLIQTADGSVQAAMVGSNYYNASSIIIANRESHCTLVAAQDATGTRYLLGSDGNFELSANGSALVYTQVGAPIWSFFSAATNTCIATPLGQNIAQNPQDLSRIKIAPNNATVAISGRQLYGMDLGGANIKMLSNLDSAGSLEGTNNGAFSFTPDSSRVIYWAKQNVTSAMQLYSAKLDGSEIRIINGALTTGGYVHSNGYNFTPQITRDSQVVVYHAAQDNSFLELYQSRIDGTGNRKISGILPLNSSVYADFSQGEFLITPDDQFAIYAVLNSSPRSIDLWAASIFAIQDPIQLNLTKPQDSSVITYDEQSFKVSLDSKYVVFMMRNNTGPGNASLYSVAIDGRNMTGLNGTLVTGGEVQRFTLSQNNNKVVYTANELDAKVISLFSVNIDGSGHRYLANVLNFGNDGYRPLLTADNRIVFRSNTQGDGLYTIPIDGGVITKIMDIPPGRIIQRVMLAPTKGLIIQADLREVGVVELFVLKI